LKKPPINEANEPADLGTSLKSWYDAVVSDAPKTKEFLSTSNSWVDVRDAALAHVLALQKQEAAGERIIVCSGKSLIGNQVRVRFKSDDRTGAYNWQEWCMFFFMSHP